MTSKPPAALLALARQWNDLHRWERKCLGQDLRKLGLTYGEIRAIIPVPKSTLATWCRDVHLDDDALKAIRIRTGPGSRAGLPVDTQWRRHDEIAFIRSSARAFAEDHLEDSVFVAGVVLYWGEGSKTRNNLDLTNADPRALRVFVSWVRRFLDGNAEFVLSLHLHEGNDEASAKRFWRSELRMPEGQFTKTFIKPEGTGHRKNHLPEGICRVRMRRASDAWHRTMVWIDVVAEHLGELEASIGSIPAGR